MTANLALTFIAQIYPTIYGTISSNSRWIAMTNDFKVDLKFYI